MNNESSPREIAVQQLRDITRKSRAVRKTIRCEAIVDELQKWQRTLDRAPGQLRDFRHRGYVHDGWLESTIKAIAEKTPHFLDDVHHAATYAMDEYGWHLDELARFLPDAEGQLSEDAVFNNSILAPLEDHVATLNRVAEDLSYRLNEKKQPLEPYYRKIDTALRQIDRTMTQFDSSDIKLLPNEHPLRAVSARLKEASDAKGRIYLTDRRFRFTGIEEKVLKKGFLGFGRKTEEILSLMIDEEIGQVRESVDSKMGFIIKDQILTLNWHESAKFPITTFEIKDNAREWDALIEDVMTGRIDRDRIRE